MTDIHTDKNSLRTEARRLRAGMHQMYGTQAAEDAANHALKLLAAEDKRSCVALYWPLGDELDPRFLLNGLERAGYRTALPVVVERDAPLVFRLWGQGDPLLKGAFNILEPDIEAPAIVPDIIIVPLLAYDAACYRLGWGGGFYDRTIAKYPQVRTFGFAYAAQIVNHIPREAHDLPLHGVITETGLLFPKR